ncbi:MAG: dolichol-phosphate mannosyltransferase [Rhodospirillaceae bacterium]|jgi:dolichol-phosphate mannosyltransferase|nr:dolichol-phosphate mannosyltransferase [Rhodospirillaceae bacterium]
MVCELSIIVPTFNEAGNVEALLARLDAALSGESWEVVFVDDNSPDGTADLVARLGRHRSNVRCLKRIGRRGLTSACVEGFAATHSPFIAVMDADLQHDEKLLPRMLAAIRAPEIDLVVASRYMPGGSPGDFTLLREMISRGGSWVARWLLGVSLSDPLSGFFMFRRDLLARSTIAQVSGRGFKLLLDLLGSIRGPVVSREFPYRFQQRGAGRSKFNLRIGWDFVLLLFRQKWSVSDRRADR